MLRLPPRRINRPLPRVHRLAPRLYYGWFVMAGSFMLSFVSVGIGFYGQTVFLDGLIREHGWSKDAVSSASTVYFIVSGVSGLFVGRGIDRIGARASIFAGAILMACSLLWLGRIDRPGELYVVYVLLAISFSMTAAVPLNAVLGRWFVARRAFAMSLSQTGVSLGGIVLVPITTLSIASRGFESTMWLLAAMVVLLILPINAFVIRWDPLEHGLAADGDVPSAIPLPPAERPRVRDAIRTRGFAVLALAFSLILFCQTGLSVHILHLLREHLSAGAAASGVSVLAVGSIVGRLCIGRIADRLDKRKLAAALFCIQSVAHFALSGATSPAALLSATLLFGLTIGSVFMLQSLLVMELFGLASFGAIFGVLNLVTSIGGGLGPMAIGRVASELGSYVVALRMLSLVAALAALTMLAVGRPRIRGPAT